MHGTQLIVRHVRFRKAFTSMAVISTLICGGVPVECGVEGVEVTSK